MSEVTAKIVSPNFRDLVVRSLTVILLVIFWTRSLTSGNLLMMIIAGVSTAGVLIFGAMEMMARKT